MQTPNCTTQPTAQQVLGATQYVQTTSAAVAKYKNLSAAVADGYVPITSTKYPVVHYLNFRYMNRQDLMNPNTVDSLVYATTPYGPVLVAAMYLMPGGGNGPMPYGCLVQWHAHTNLCTSNAPVRSTACSRVTPGSHPDPTTPVHDPRVASSRPGRAPCHRPLRPRGRPGGDHGAATGPRPDDVGPAARPDRQVLERRATHGADVGGSMAKGPDSSAVRVALWRALHVQIDAPPHVLEDEVGLLLANPDDGWRQRPDMDPDATQGIPGRHRGSGSLRGGSRGRSDRRGNSTSTSYWAPAWIPSPSATPPPARTCVSSKSISPRPRPGSANGWPSSTTTSPTGCSFVPVDFEAGRVMARPTDGQRFRQRRTGVRRLDRGEHVPHQGRRRGDTAPGGDTGTRIDVGHVVPPALGVARPR